MVVFCFLFIFGVVVQGFQEGGFELFVCSILLYDILDVEDVIVVEVGFEYVFGGDVDLVVGVVEGLVVGGDNVY